MEEPLTGFQLLLEDNRFKKAINLFNSADWYSAHDAFEELWHEANGAERVTLQAFLQIAVAHIHLESGNLNGATILYGEALGRLKNIGIPDLGVDIEIRCECINQRLGLLQQDRDPDQFSVPFLTKRDERDS